MYFGCCRWARVCRGSVIGSLFATGDIPWLLLVFEAAVAGLVCPSHVSDPLNPLKPTAGLLE